MLEVKTSKGTFAVQLFDKQAPISVENFLKYRVWFLRSLLLLHVIRL